MNNEENIFRAKNLRRFAQDIEFEHFKAWALKEVEALKDEIPRFKPLAQEYGFTSSLSGDGTIQLSFVKRKMWRRDLDGKWAIENGSSLVYSLGQHQIATVLYPSKSELASTHESLIYLRVGYYTAYQLRKRFRGDLKDWVAYAYVSSIDTTPTFGQWLRIWWLRKTHPLRTDDKYVEAPHAEILSTTAKFSATTLFIALMKPVAILIVFALLILFGYTDLAKQVFWR